MQKILGNMRKAIQDYNMIEKFSGHDELTEA